MSSSNYRVRRATLDDIAALGAIWRTMRLPVEDLARRVTEFQVGEDRAGKILGAIALQMSEKQGLIHSEAFDDFAHAEALRPMIWERLNAVANNHGLLRLWTAEQAPFWHRCGLIRAEPDELEKLPKLWKGLTSPLLTVKLRDDVEALLSADSEFALFMQAEKQRTQRTLQHAKALKLLATLIAFAVLIIAGVGIFMMLKRNPQILPH